jgi:hypothetical protein
LVKGKTQKEGRKEEGTEGGGREESFQDILRRNSRNIQNATRSGLTPFIHSIRKGMSHCTHQ